MNEALDRLGSLAGIVESYLDIYGQEHRPSQDTKRRILTAMGFPCQTPAEVSGSLLELANRPWRCVVDPVTILAEGAAPSLPMHIPERLEKAAWRWDLQREDGRTDSGEFRPFALPQEGSRTLEGQAVSRRRLLLPSGVEAGYHTLRLSQGNAYAESLLICAPERAWLPSWFLRGERRWGVACQAFGLRRQRDWGSGDYAALGALAAQGGAWGADALGISPLHALFAEKPEEASPYYPSSRLFLNPLYLAPESIAGFAECAPALATLKAPATQALLAQSRGSTLVDYTAAWKLKLPVLRLLFDCFQKQHPPGVNSDALRRDFTDFNRTEGEPLHRFALFEALQQRHPGQPWNAWPQELRHPDSARQSPLAKDLELETEFHKFLQWQSQLQLSSVARQGAEAGMETGLYRDLAVGSSPFGADAWALQDLMVPQARVGAPPDNFNAQGQDWGFAPAHPHRLRTLRYRPFIELLRSNMRHAGALRMDHVMSLENLYWVLPEGKERSGAYVRYSFQELSAIVALESHRHRCLVVGEDLGTLPYGFQERLANKGILSYRVFLFERWENGLFRRPDTYPAQSLATAGTHDLPTLCGYWQGRDVERDAGLGLLPDAQAIAQARARRQRDKELLRAALADQGLLVQELSGEAGGEAEQQRALILAVQRFLARSSARLYMASLEDLVGSLEQINVPGTVNEYPNWRHRLALPLEALSESTGLDERIRVLQKERPKPR